MLARCRVWRVPSLVARIVVRVLKEILVIATLKVWVVFPPNHPQARNVATVVAMATPRETEVLGLAREAAEGLLRKCTLHLANPRVHDVHAFQCLRRWVNRQHRIRNNACDYSGREHARKRTKKEHLRVAHAGATAASARAWWDREVVAGARDALDVDGRRIGRHGYTAVRAQKARVPPYALRISRALCRAH